MTQIASLPSPATFRKSGRNYRRWMQEHKRQIVEETFVPGASVSVVARCHDVNANQVFKWRVQYHRGELGRTAEAPAGFVPVVLAEQGSTAASVPLVKSLPSPAPLAQTSAQAERKPRTDIIQLELRNGVKLKLHAGINPAALRQVLLILREAM